MATETFVTEYKGCNIYRVNHSGMYNTLMLGYGFLRADTLKGMKQLITDAKAGRA